MVNVTTFDRPACVRKTATLIQDIYFFLFTNTYFFVICLLGHGRGILLACIAVNYMVTSFFFF